MIKIRQTIIFICMIAFLSKCSDVQLSKNSKPSIQIHEKTFIESPDVEFNGNYLIFPTPESFQKTIESIRNSNPQSVLDWNNKMGFNSIRTIYKKALEEQETYMKNLLVEYQSLPTDDPRLKIKPTIIQSSYIQQNLNLFEFDKTGLILRPSISDWDITGLVNKDGIVKVAGHLFQYNKDNIKIIIGGDANKIQLLKTINETNNKLNIVVNPVVITPLEKSTETSASDNGRIHYDYVYSSAHWQSIGTDIWHYYMIVESHISYYVYPIYDTTTPICEPEGCGQARILAGDCSCYYPIIGYNAYTRYETHMETRREILGASVSYQSDTGTISVDYKISNGPWVTGNAYTTYGLANTYLTLYDAMPAIEFTCANEDFTVTFYPNFTKSVNTAWCD